MLFALFQNHAFLQEIPGTKIYATRNFLLLCCPGLLFTDVEEDKSFLYAKIWILEVPENIKGW